ncbi:MAG TPA: radical SAM protein [Acetobacteraceae bacterium]|nr:radical SAM protein [Acetobacteraceae bacterium]
MPVLQRNPFAVPARLRRLQIEITTGCNLRCAGCQRTLGMAAGSWRNAHMPARIFAAILRNAPPADTIILQGIGEPTLHPDLPQLIAAARGAGKFGAVSFNTNALVREPAYYQALRAAGLDHVSVSVDSLDPRTAQATRAGTDCQRLTEAIQALIALFGPTVTLSILLSRHNAEELPELLQRLNPSLTVRVPFSVTTSEISSKRLGQDLESVM